VIVVQKHTGLKTKLY